ncbi:MAG: Stk1 family PASTA domain-containing Ser/Thr kinase [Actinomycetota bacterium]
MIRQDAPELIAERYRIAARIGAGAMGEVFRARDIVLGRPVAVKVLPEDLAVRPGFVEKFRAEAQAAARLSHPNAVQVHDWGTSDGMYFMVMEYVRGRTLREVVTTRGVLQPAQAALITAQVLAALEAAHASGLVHRDIKPENVLVTAEGTAKVSDFGIAHMMEESAGTGERAGELAGTAAYVSPEQIRGEAVDGRADLYSVGCMLYELLCGAPPFEGNVAHVLHQHLSARVPAPSIEAPAAAPLDGVVLRSTDPSPSGRYASAAAMRQDLQEAAAALPAAPPLGELVSEVTSMVATEAQETMVVPVAKRRKRRTWPLVVAALLALILADTAVFVRPVPKVVGVTEATALARLHRAGLKVTQRSAFNDSVPQGNVISASAALGAFSLKGTSVVLTVSKGPDVRQVPSVLGRLQTDAEQAIKAVGLLPVEMEPVYSSDAAFPAGTVLLQSPGPQAVRPGTPVNLTVSKGAQLVGVQSVVGAGFSAAQAKLVQAGLNVSRQNVFSDAPLGQVVDQTPKAPATVATGGLVTLIVSQGPRPFPMPKVVAIACSVAKALLQSKGLVVSVTSQSGTCGANKVLLQDPLDQIAVQKGATATLYVP